MSLTYRGNQLLKANDVATNPTLSMTLDFKDGARQEIEYDYDADGNQVKDLNKGISKIEYNVLNLPKKITFTGANNPATTYVYSADGDKLNVTHSSSTSKRTDYVGNKIYENGSLKRILVEGGYYELAVNSYCFYLQDHKGNNRVVADQSGSVIQSNHYYPYGMPFAESTYTDKQPYKYNGKELDIEYGLNQYDYEARYTDAAFGRFTTPDPLSEKYYSMSPYTYCANNPVKYVDPTGRKIVIWYKNESGKQVSFAFNGQNAIKAPNNRFVNSVITAYNYNVGNGGGKNLKIAATSAKFDIGVVETDKSQKYSPSGFIRFNPTTGLKLPDGNILSPATGLEHEAAHGVNDKTIGMDERADSKFTNMEERKVIKGAELETAKANKEVTSTHTGRKSHAEGIFVVTKSVTSNEEVNKSLSDILRRRIENFK